MPRLNHAPFWVGLCLLLAGAGAALAVGCPTPLQAYAIVVVAAIGSSSLVYGFLGQFQLSGIIKGISSGGAGTVLLLLFFFTPDAIDKLACPEAFSLVVHVCEECPAGPVSGADVSIQGLSTVLEQTDEYGEARLRYGNSRVGEVIQVWAEHAGRRTAHHRETLKPVSALRISLPLPRPGSQRPVQVSTATVGDRVEQPPTVESVLASLERADTPDKDELLAAGLAAYNAKDYEASVELFEAVRDKTPLTLWVSDAPFLAAAYAQLGNTELASRTISEIEAAASEAPSAAEGRFLAANVRELAPALGEVSTARLVEAARPGGPR
jgi:hypothetical protein